MELVFLVFLISGFLKSLLFATAIKLPDITILSFVFMLLYILVQRAALFKITIVELFPFLLYESIMLLSSIYTSSDNVFMEKLLKSQTTIFAFLIPFFLRKFDFAKFTKYWLISTSMLSFYFNFFILPYVYVNPIYYEIAGNYLFVSLVSGVNILLLLLNPFKASYSKLFINLLLIVNIINLFLCGGRGGLVALSLVMLILVVIKTLRLDFLVILNIRYFLYCISIIFFSFLTLSIVFEEKLLLLFKSALTRITLLLNFLLEGDGGKSIEERVKFLEFSLNKINESPFWGYGIGSFGKEFSGSDIILYPHNIFLEAWFELGILGLITITTIIFFNYWLLIIKKRYDLLLVNIYFLINAMKSSGFHDLRIMFGFMALSVLHTIKGGKNERP